MSTSEQSIQNQIRTALSPYCIIFRINVGSAYTKDNRYFKTGVPCGFSDLFGVRKSDGKAVFIEVKRPKGRVRNEQIKFLENMKNTGALCGIAYSVEDAIKIIKGE